MESRIQHPESRRAPAKSFEDLIVARDLGYADVTDAAVQLEEVSRLLEAYHSRILNSGF